MRILIFGNGYIGNRLRDFWPDAIISEVRIDDPIAVREALKTHSPDAVVNTAGKTGKPNVDWCETHQIETARPNVIGPIVLAEACQELNMYLIHLGSGCIFYGDAPNPLGWTEDDATLPVSYYSKTKLAADLALSPLPNTAVVRLRLPVDFLPHPKNLITKLSAYPQVIDVKNSVTFLEDLANVLHAIAEKRGCGIFHATNPEPLSYRRLLDRYRELVDQTHSCNWISEEELVSKGLVAKARATCVMQSSRLAELGIHMRPTEVALQETLEKYATQRHAQNLS